MTDRLHRWSLLAGPLAVVLWVAGIVTIAGITDSLSDSASDDTILAWYKGNANTILLGAWMFMLGCLCFVWFCAVLRARLAGAEGAGGMLATVAFAGGAAAAVFGMLIPAGDIAVAINKDDVSAATAGALHHVSDGFFVCAELAVILLLVATAVLAFRTGVLPRWWAVFSLLLAIVLVIGPIGWAGLIFGMPVWTVGTTVLLALRSGERRVRSVAPAAA
jgi:hypothetical protein